MKRRVICFTPIASILLTVIVMLIFDCLRAWMPWSLIVAVFLLLVLTAWLVKGIAIFYPSFYRPYRVGQVHEITGAHKDKDGTIRFKNNTVKEKTRKKRFEL